ncbi:uncharacterized protein LOC144134112 [Amblyomma americanum]
MTGSVGAATAVMSGRGNRAFASDEEYQVILPTLPTGRVVLNTVFLHADVRARPYRVEDFRDALAQLMLLPEVIALGAYRMSHVWAVTFASAEAVTKILSAGALKVKDRRCLVIDPANQDVRVKLHWLLHNVPDEDVRVAFAPYGKVNEVTKERWRVQGVASKGSTTRLVSLKMNPGVKLEDLPHEVRVGGELALVVVPGRAPLCLRCHGTGHIRRECKVPRCGACRRYGHEESSCVRTYASAAVPVNTDISSERVMDEADAEDAAAEAGDRVEKAPAVPPVEISTSKAAKVLDVNDLLQDEAEVEEASKGAEEKSGKDAKSPEEKSGGDPKAKASDSPSLTASEPEPTATNTTTGAISLSSHDGRSATDKAEAMDASETGTSGAVVKRTHDELATQDGQPSEPNNDELPPKTPGVRRLTLRPQPKIPPDRRSAVTPT